MFKANTLRKPDFSYVLFTIITQVSYSISSVIGLRSGRIVISPKSS